MILYNIVRSGHIIGSARGKNKAIQSIKRHLSFNGEEHIGKWKTIAGQIYCEVNNGGMESVYTIERSEE